MSYEVGPSGPLRYEPKVLQSDRCKSHGEAKDIGRELFRIENVILEPKAIGSSAVAKISFYFSCGMGTKKKQPKTSKNMRTFVTHEFPALFDENCEVLMLGSIPSPKSREQGFYYGHPQNRFWKVLAQVLNEPLPATIDEKRSMLLKHHIALWDVLDSCTIIGASDTSIEDAVPNDIDSLLAKTKIKRIFCTGATAHKLYEKYCEAATGIKAVKLPSTSPANCAVKFETLVNEYRVIRQEKWPMSPLKK